MTDTELPRDPMVPIRTWSYDESSHIMDAFLHSMGNAFRIASGCHDDQGHHHRTCFHCKKDLWYDEAIVRRPAGIAIARFGEIWDDPIFEILCCHCFDKETHHDSWGTQMANLALEHVSHCTGIETTFMRGVSADHLIFDECAEIEAIIDNIDTRITTAMQQLFGDNTP
jgi:hypothetical protein